MASVWTGIVDSALSRSGDLLAMIAPVVVLLVGLAVFAWVLGAVVGVTQRKRG